MPRSIVAKPETWVISKGVSLDRGLLAQVDEIAARQKKSRSEFVGEALTFYLSVLTNSGISGQKNGNNRESSADQSNAAPSVTDAPEEPELEPLR